MPDIKSHNHREMRTDEVFIANVRPAVFSSMTRWKTRRAGQTAYKDDVTVDPERIPVFVSREEFEKAGFKLVPV